MFFSSVKKVSISILIIALILQPVSSVAQGLGSLPVPGAMVPLSSAYVPAMIEGMTISPSHPFEFDFIIDSGQEAFNTDSFKQESEKLIRYFLAALTIPDDDLWVNLSPQEEDRVITDELIKTEMGQTMLAQDYLLKQVTSSLLYPESETGKAFWQKVYAKAAQELGTTDIPMDTFHKVWILPEEAKLYVHENTVYIVDSHLKVMLDADYQNHRREENFQSSALPTHSTDMMRSVVLPVLEEEVNAGEHFAPLRQIYHALILANWYKQTIKDSLIHQVYANQKKVLGVDLAEEGAREKIYQRYIQAYKKGVFNFIKEEYDVLTQETLPRKYFSGGVLGQTSYVEVGSDQATRSTVPEPSHANAGQYRVTWRGQDLAMLSDDPAMTSDPDNNKAMLSEPEDEDEAEDQDVGKDEPEEDRALKSEVPELSASGAGQYRVSWRGQDSAMPALGPGEVHKAALKNLSPLAQVQIAAHSVGLPAPFILRTQKNILHVQSDRLRRVIGKPWFEQALIANLNQQTKQLTLGKEVFSEYPNQFSKFNYRRVITYKGDHATFFVDFFFGGVDGQEDSIVVSTDSTSQDLVDRQTNYILTACERALAAVSVNNNTLHVWDGFFVQSAFNDPDFIERLNGYVSRLLRTQTAVDVTESQGGIRVSSVSFSSKSQAFFTIFLNGTEGVPDQISFQLADGFPRTNLPAILETFKNALDNYVVPVSRTVRLFKGSLIIQNQERVEQMIQSNAFIEILAERLKGALSAREVSYKASGSPGSTRHALEINIDGVVFSIVNSSQDKRLIIDFHENTPANVFDIVGAVQAAFNEVDFAMEAVTEQAKPPLAIAREEAVKANQPMPLYVRGKDGFTTHVRGGHLFSFVEQPWFNAAVIRSLRKTLRNRFHLLSSKQVRVVDPNISEFNDVHVIRDRFAGRDIHVYFLYGVSGQDGQISIVPQEPHKPFPNEYANVILSAYENAISIATINRENLDIWDSSRVFQAFESDEFFTTIAGYLGSIFNLGGVKYIRSSASEVTFYQDGNLLTIQMKKTRNKKSIEYLIPILPKKFREFRPQIMSMLKNTLDTHDFAMETATDTHMGKKLMPSAPGLPSPLYQRDGNALIAQSVVLRQLLKKRWFASIVKGAIRDQNQPHLSSQIGYVGVNARTASLIHVINYRDDTERVRIPVNFLQASDASEDRISFDFSRKPELADQYINLFLTAYERAISTVYIIGDRLSILNMGRVERIIHNVSFRKNVAQYLGILLGESNIVSAISREEDSYSVHFNVGSEQITLTAYFSKRRVSRRIEVTLPQSWEGRRSEILQVLKNVLDTHDLAMLSGNDEAVQPKIFESPFRVRQRLHAILPWRWASKYQILQPPVHPRVPLDERVSQALRHGQIQTGSDDIVVAQEVSDQHGVAFVTTKNGKAYIIYLDAEPARGELYQAYPLTFPGQSNPKDPLNRIILKQDRKNRDRVHVYLSNATQRYYMWVQSNEFSPLMDAAMTTTDSPPTIMDNSKIIITSPHSVERIFHMLDFNERLMKGLRELFNLEVSFAGSNRRLDTFFRYFYVGTYTLHLGVRIKLTEGAQEIFVELPPAIQDRQGEVLAVVEKVFSTYDAAMTTAEPRVAVDGDQIRILDEQKRLGRFAIDQGFRNHVASEIGQFFDADASNVGSNRNFDSFFSSYSVQGYTIGLVIRSHLQEGAYEITVTVPGGLSKRYHEILEVIANAFNTYDAAMPSESEDNPWVQHWENGYYYIMHDPSAIRSLIEQGELEFLLSPFAARLNREEYQWYVFQSPLAIDGNNQAVAELRLIGKEDRHRIEIVFDFTQTEEVSPNVYIVYYDRGSPATVESVPIIYTAFQQIFSPNVLQEQRTNLNTLIAIGKEGFSIADPDGLHKLIRGETKFLAALNAFRTRLIRMYQSFYPVEAMPSFHLLKANNIKDQTSISGPKGVVQINFSEDRNIPGYAPAAMIQVDFDKGKIRFPQVQARDGKPPSDKTEGFLFKALQLSLLEQPDKAMATTLGTTNTAAFPGGIDFNPNNINYTYEGNTATITYDPTLIEDIRVNGIQGLSPFIIQITPLQSVWPLLGLSPYKEERGIRLSRT